MSQELADRKNRESGSSPMRRLRLHFSRSKPTHAGLAVRYRDKCQQKNILTGCITCNEGSPVTKYADFPIAAVVGPEFVTGSTRMKAGTAQKLILNMISTSVMIQLGRVKGNKMVDMQLSNNKLIDRGTRMVMNELKIDESTAADLLNKHGNVRAAIEAYNQK